MKEQTMQLGNRKRFAIQWDIDLDTCGPLLYGRVCFWVTDNMIGNYDACNSLLEVLGNLTYLVGDCGDRDSSRFCSMTAHDAFSLVQRGLFESDDTVSSIVESERWARFDVSLPVNGLSSYRMYLFDCQSESRLLIGANQPNQDGFDLVLEQRLRKGEFDDIISSFQAELDVEGRTEQRGQES